MKKRPLALLIGLTLILSGCKDEQLIQKLVEAENQIMQLQSRLSNTQSELAHMHQRFPALRVEIVPLFDQTKTLTFPSEPNNEYSREESEVSVFASTANTQIAWLDKLLNQTLIQHYLTDEQWTEEYENVSDEALQQFFANLHQEFQQKAEEDRPIAYTTSATTHYIGQRHKLVRFIQTFEHYSGGAHGIYHNHHLNIDTEKQKLITLTDLLPSEHYSAFSMLLWQKYQTFLKNNGELEEPFIHQEDFFIPDNFYFSATGIHFIYPLYSLAPFVMGEIELITDYDEITQWVNADYLPPNQLHSPLRN